MDGAIRLLTDGLACCRRIQDVYPWVRAVILTDLVELQHGADVRVLEEAGELAALGPLPDLAERLAPFQRRTPVDPQTPGPGQTPRQTVGHLASWCPDERRPADDGGWQMPLFMDVHQSLPEGATFDDVTGAHEADLRTQDSHGVSYLRYWVDENAGKVFCLVDAPSAEAAAEVHREAHGLVADEIYPVREGS